jgi:uncharacterized protein (DUF342 family)
MGLMDSNNQLITELKKCNEEIEKLKEYLDSIKTRSKVSASSKVYPGAKIIIRDVVNDVQTEYRAVTFILEGGLIRVTKYEEPDEEAKKAPDGYTAD